MTRSRAAFGAAGLLALAGLAMNLTAASATSLTLAGDGAGVTTVLWQASFAPPSVPRRLSVTVVGEGMIVSDPIGIACDAGTCYKGYPDGTSVTLSPIFTQAYPNLAWTGCDEISEWQDCIVVLTADRAVTAEFTQ